MRIDSLDHFVLVVSDIDMACAFYTRVLGMRQVVFGDNRKALVFGQQKINLHQVGRGFEPKAACPAAGSADICFLTRTPLAEVAAHFVREGVPVVEGPVRRTGAQGPIMSLYIRDPDGNLLELSNPLVG